MQLKPSKDVSTNRFEPDYIYARSISVSRSNRSRIKQARGQANLNFFIVCFQLEELKEVSHTAQEAKLDRELLRFEDMLELFLADKDMFLEDLYRRLKQVTSLWRSWRVQRLRDVPVTHLVSTKQVKTAIRDIRTWVN